MAEGGKSDRSVGKKKHVYHLQYAQRENLSLKKQLLFATGSKGVCGKCDLLRNISTHNTETKVEASSKLAHHLIQRTFKSL